MIRGVSASALLEELEGNSDDEELYQDGEDESLSTMEINQDNNRKKKSTTTIKKEKIKTRFNELSFEVLLQVIDYIFPFYSYFEKITRSSSNIDFSNRRQSVVLLGQVLHGLFSNARIVEWIKEFSLGYQHFSVKSGQYKYLTDSRSIFAESLFMRQFIIDEIVQLFYNLIRVSKRTFYSFLIEDCYDLLVVKLIWEGLYQCIRNPDLVLSNARVSLEKIQVLPASHYILTEPVYSAVLRSRHEPVWFNQLFLSQPSFGLSPWIKWKRSKISKNYESKETPTQLEWKQFLRFFQKQLARYPLLKTDQKYYGTISGRCEYIKECGFDPDEIIKLIYLEEGIPVGSVKVLQSIESVAILKLFLSKNNKLANITELCCYKNDLLKSSIQNVRTEILDCIMDIQKSKILQLKKDYLDFSPVHVMIDTCLSMTDFKKKKGSIVTSLKKMREHFLPVRDIFQIVSKSYNPVAYLIIRVGEIYKESRWMDKTTCDFHSVFETFYALFIEILSDEEYEQVARLSNIVLAASRTPFCFSSLFSSKFFLSSHAKALHKKLLAIPEDNVFGSLIQVCIEERSHKTSSLECLKLALGIALDNVSEFTSALVKSEIYQKRTTLEYYYMDQFGLYNDVEFFTTVMPLIMAICENK